MCDLALMRIEKNLSDVSAEDWFVNCVKDRGVEPKVTTTESDDNQTRILTDQINCAIHAINSLRFKERPCPLQEMQFRLQTKSPGLEIIEENPILFTMFKQKLKDEFQDSFAKFYPLLKYVNIRYFKCQVKWLWELLLNITPDDGTYERLMTIIDM